MIVIVVVVCRTMPQVNGSRHVSIAAPCDALRMVPYERIPASGGVAHRLRPKWFESSESSESSAGTGPTHRDGLPLRQVIRSGQPAPETIHELWRGEVIRPQLRPHSTSEAASQSDGKCSQAPEADAGRVDLKQKQSRR